MRARMTKETTKLALHLSAHSTPKPIPQPIPHLNTPLPLSKVGAQSAVSAGAGSSDVNCLQKINESTSNRMLVDPRALLLRFCRFGSGLTHVSLTSRLSSFRNSFNVGIRCIDDISPMVSAASWRMMGSSFKSRRTRSRVGKAEGFSLFKAPHLSYLNSCFNKSFC